MARVPVWLVAGFLGSGKTTVLRRLAAGGKRLIFVVNEFASVDVDAERIARDGGFCVGIPGGSLFCRCLVTRFYSELSALHERFWHVPADSVGGRGRYEGVVVECSGLADPRSAAQLLRETKLDGLYRIAGVTTVVDPGAAAKLFSVLPVFRWQIECSDTVLVNKTDLFSSEQVETAVGLVRSIRSGLKVVCCSQGQVDVETILNVRREDLGTGAVYAALATCRDSRLADGAHRFLTTVCHARLCAALSSLDTIEGLQRVKGSVKTTGGAWEADWCPHQSVLKRIPIDEASFESRLVVLGASEAVEMAIERFERLDTT